MVTAIKPPAGYDQDVSLSTLKKHVKEKAPDGLTLNDIEEHLQHHAPGQEKEDQGLFNDFVILKLNFNKISGGDDTISLADLNKIKFTA